jgi:3',5'-cyclic AMP phosphodiesterase CpdA
MDQDDSRLQVIQLTDCHLFADPSIELRGMFTWPRFQAVLKDIRHQFAGADLLVLTGDTAHDELQATYEVVRGELGPWCDRLRIIPGNHDNRSAITRVFPEACSVSGDRVTFDMRWKNWQLIGLDSQLPGEVAEVWKRSSSSGSTPDYANRLKRKRSFFSIIPRSPRTAPGWISCCCGMPRSLQAYWRHIRRCVSWDAVTCIRKSGEPWHMRRYSQPPPWDRHSESAPSSSRLSHELPATGFWNCMRMGAGELR